MSCEHAHCCLPAEIGVKKCAPTLSLRPDPAIVMVDRGFMVDRPWIDHAENYHVIWLIGLLGEWLIVGLIWGRFVRTRSVRGRIWDDHFRTLGYPPKLYSVHDAGFVDGSLSG